MKLTKSKTTWKITFNFYLKDKFGNFSLKVKKFDNKRKRRKTRILNDIEIVLIQKNVEEMPMPKHK